MGCARGPVGWFEVRCDGVVYRTYDPAAYLTAAAVVADMGRLIDQLGLLPAGRVLRFEVWRDGAMVAVGRHAGSSLGLPPGWMIALLKIE